MDIKVQNIYNEYSYKYIAKELHNLSKTDMKRNNIISIFDGPIIFKRSYD